MLPANSPNGRHVVIVGAGGNIGSQLVPHIARLRSVDRVTLIDRDSYEAANILTQNITEPEIGLPKVNVQRQRIEAISPGKKVTAIHDEVERVPVSVLRGTVVLSCLDSRRSRQYVNWATRRLGVPWIDAGVQANGLLARVSNFLPDPQRACLECAWSQEDYRLVEQIYPCNGASSPYSTNAPAYLGGLAAAMQANECAKYIEGSWADTDSSQEVVLEGRRYRTYVTPLGCNPACRFNHRTWALESFDRDPERVTIEEVFRWASERSGGDMKSLALFTENAGFVTGLACLRGCSSRAITRRLPHRILEREKRCAVCDDIMQSIGLHIEEKLRYERLSASERAATLADLGFLIGDVFGIGCGETILEVEISGVEKSDSKKS